MSKRDTIENLIKEIFTFEKAFRDVLNAQARELGLTTSQFKVLKVLYEQGEMRHKDLTEKTLITKGTLTGVVDRLERSNLVTRRKDDRDSRAQIVTLTDHGKDSFKKINRDYRTMLAKIFDSQSEEQLNVHRKNVNELLNVVTEGLAQAQEF